MCQAAGGKEDSHHWTGGRNAKKDHNCPDHPSSLQKRLALSHMPVRREQREQKEGIEKEDRRAFQPSPDGIDAHRVGGNSDHCAEGKKQALGPGPAGMRAQNKKGATPTKANAGRICARVSVACEANTASSAANGGGAECGGCARATIRLRTTATEMIMHAQNPARNQRDEGRFADDSWISSCVCRLAKSSVPVVVKNDPTI